MKKIERFLQSQGRKRPLGTPERKIERREIKKERLRRKHTVMTETHSENQNTQ